MDEKIAGYLVRSLIARLSQTDDGDYRLGDGKVSAEEFEALCLLAGKRVEKTVSSGSVAPAPALISERIDLNLESLEASPEEGSHICIDFGTAYSKAALWLEDEETPRPLDLGSAGGGTGAYPIQSCAYVTDGMLLFGDVAQQRFEQENDDTRELFSSPKQYLTHAFADLSCAAKQSIDPSRTFTTGELLTLYLGFLTATASDRIRQIGIDKPLARRFALPGWNSAQVDTPSDAGPASMLRSQFLRAQILADSIPIDMWLSGFSAAKARSALDQLAAVDAKRFENSTHGGEPVLEAIAASSGVYEKFLNIRPQLLVVDVGAGTTDIGVFKVATPKGRPSLAAPYRNGMAAIRRAGESLDEILITEVCRELGLSSEGQLAGIFQRKLRRVVRSYKAELFDRGSTVVEIEDYGAIPMELPKFLAAQPIRRFADTFRQAVCDTLNVAGVGSGNFVNTKDDNLVVFTGGGSRLPFLTSIFDKPLELEAGKVKFQLRDPEPEWVSDFGPDFRSVFPQLAVATGGAAPDLPNRKTQIMDTQHAAERKVRFFTG